MRKIRKLSRGGKVVFALAVVASAFGVATAVQAAIPSNGVIYGCYAKPGNPSQGALRVVDQGTQCKPGESPINWNQVGPTGPAGPTGPEGPKTGTERQGAVAPDGS